MSKKIKGSYVSIEETIQAVRGLLKDGEYLSSDIRIITNRANHENLKNLTSVQVEKVSTIEDKSAWERFRKMFSSASDEATLEKYGIEMHEAVKFEEDLKEGHYLVLAEEYPENGQNHPQEVSSVADAIVDARDDFSSNQPINDKEAQADARPQSGVVEEDPLLNGSVDRGPIYGVVNEETNEETFTDNKEKPI